MPALAERVNKINSSPTLKLVQIKKQLEAQGRKILDFGAGEPDFSTPEHIKQAGIAAIQNDFTKYTPTAGIMELKEAIAARYAEEQGYTPQHNEIVVTPGSKFALFIMLQALVGSGDEVIVPCPYWVSYPEMVRFCGATPIFADQLAGPRRFAITADSYLKCYSPRTRAVIVNSPSNPTGMLMSAEDLGQVVSFFAERGTMVIIDDCYRHITYTEEPYPAPFPIAGTNKDKIAVVSSLSKTFAMTGWRMGYALADAELSAAMVKIQEHSTSNPCSISQKAAVAALNGGRQTVQAMVAEYRKRRDLVAARLQDIGDIDFALPQGAFYFFADFSPWISRLGLADDQELAMEMLNRLNIIVVPGSAFGAPGHLRISYATALAQLQQGLDLIEEWLKGS